jgi:nanoRNase/pAp phosphatase (c-di-AMP/oligoRNAs hydrolase)
MKKIKKLIKLIKSEKIVYIQPHNFPDPDGIASAFGLCELIKSQGIASKILYYGALQRSIMLSMIDQMAIDIEAVEEGILSISDKVIVVDCSPVNSNVMPLGGTIIGVIDHHEFTKSDKYPFTDVRPEVGATSSIITSYFDELKIIPTKHIATALAVGINIDTAYLTRKVTKFDIDMYSKIISLVDIDLMRFIVINNLELKDIGYIRQALDNFRTKNNFLCANIGENLESNFTGIMSDFFLSLKEIDFVVIYTKIQTGYIISVRNLDKNWNAALVVREALEGIGTGGGHKHMAGGFIKVVDNTFEEDDIFNRFCRVLFKDNPC